MEGNVKTTDLQSRTNVLRLRSFNDFKEQIVHDAQNINRSL